MSTKDTIELMREIELAANEGREIDLQASIDLSNRENVDLMVDVLERMEQASEYYKKKADQYSKMRRAIESVQAKTERYLKDLALTADSKTLDGEHSYFRVSRSKPKLMIDEAMLPKEFLKTVTALVPDKTLIESELNLGAEIPGVSQEISYSLRSYLKREIA